MSEGYSLINLSNLTKPATVLINKVSAAIGMIFEPIHHIRMARAKAEVQKIEINTRIELNELEQRAMQRFVGQETRKQANIEQITALAAAALPSDADKVENLEEDWVAYFFKQCDTVSDKEMQSLWARLLAGEATNPGSFSKRTVDFISTIDKTDAALFTSLGQFVWMLSEPTPLIYDFNDGIYTKHQITFETLQHLDSIGLISFESGGGIEEIDFNENTYVSYYGQSTLIEFNRKINNTLKIGHAVLTRIGRELVPICGSSRNEEIYNYIISRWYKMNLILSSEVLHRR